MLPRHTFLQCVDVVVAELNERAAGGANKVVVLSVRVDIGLKACLTVVKVMAAGQTAFLQQLECAIDGRQAHFGVAFAHGMQHALGCHVFIEPKECLGDELTLFGCLQSLFIDTSAPGL